MCLFSLLLVFVLLQFVLTPLPHCSIMLHIVARQCSSRPFSHCPDELQCVRLLHIVFCLALGLVLLFLFLSGPWALIASNNKREKHEQIMVRMLVCVELVCVRDIQITTRPIKESCKTESI